MPMVNLVIPAVTYMDRDVTFVNKTVVRLGIYVSLRCTTSYI